MYGGGFATIPAYLADLFGTQHVGAIHGRLLTAWSVAGILGPVVVNYIREFQLHRGVPAYQAYNTTLYILAAFLLIGLISNLLVRPVADKHFMSDEELAAERRKAHEVAAATPAGGAAGTVAAGTAVAPTETLTVALAWLAVGIPLAWGIWTTLNKALPLFGIR
jgi:MFS family permease